MITHKFISPVMIITGVRKKRKNYLNLNNYPHWHYQHYNKLKIMYKNIMCEQLVNVKLHKIIIEYVLYPARKGGDRSNVTSVINKFFADTLVSCGCLENDTDEFIIEEKHSTGHVDSKNPRCEIFVYDIN